MALPPHLGRAYRQSCYSVAGQNFRIGRKAPALDCILAGLGVRQAVLLTAWNPRSRLKPASWNARRQADLLRRLHGRMVLSGTSAWRGWSEEMLLLADNVGRGRFLGRVFGQAALVLIRRGERPKLVPLI